MVGLLASTLSAMWSLLAYSFSAGKGLELEQMQATALLLKRVLRKGPPISDAFTCAACGALSVLPAAALPAGISPLLTALLPDATGRSLEAIATLLAALVSGATPGNIYMCVCVRVDTRRRARVQLLHLPYISPYLPYISLTSPYISPGAKHECNSFIGCRGALVVLDKCHQLVDLQHAAQYPAAREADAAYPSHEHPTHLKGGAVRARAVRVRVRVRAS